LVFYHSKQQTQYPSCFYYSFSFTPGEPMTLIKHMGMFRIKAAAHPTSKGDAASRNTPKNPLSRPSNGQPEREGMRRRTAERIFSALFSRIVPLLHITANSQIYRTFPKTFPQRFHRQPYPSYSSWHDQRPVRSKVVFLRRTPCSFHRSFPPAQTGRPYRE